MAGNAQGCPLWKEDNSAEAEERKQAIQARRKGDLPGRRKVQGPWVARGREDVWAVSSQRRTGLQKKQEGSGRNVVLATGSYWEFAWSVGVYCHFGKVTLPKVCVSERKWVLWGP